MYIDINCIAFSMSKFVTLLNPHTWSRYTIYAQRNEIEYYVQFME